jgi:putative flippase GtrA
MAEAKKQLVVIEMIKYALVGAVSTAIDIALLNLVKTVIGWPLWLALALGFLGGTINGYYMNSRWTFRYNTEGQEGKKFSQFAIVSLIGLGLTELIVNGYVEYINLGMNIFIKEISAMNVGKLVAVVLVFFWNYGGNKIWTFSGKSEILNPKS